MAFDTDKLLAFSIGRVILRPAASFEQRFNDNVLYDATDNQISDLISVLGGGIELQAGNKGKFRLDLDYSFEQSFYWKRSDLDALNHYILVNSTYHGDRIEITGRDQIALLSDVLGGSTSLRELVDRVTFSDDYRIEYRISPKTRAHIGLNHHSADYEYGSPLFDYRSIRGTIGGGMMPSPKTQVIGEIYYVNSWSSPNFPSPDPPDLSAIGAFAGVRGEFSKKLSGFIKGGYEHRSFDQSAGTSSSPVFDISLDYRAGTKTRTSLSYARSSGVSVQYASESYVVDSVTASVNQRLGGEGKWNASLALNAAHYSYQNALSGLERSDWIYSASASVTYSMQKWLTGSLAVSHEAFESDLQGVIDYAVNRVTLKILVGY